jgi:predicted ribosome quality control (RQC) complex YloA/Tae2 family protein
LDIGNARVAGESNTTRIGTNGKSDATYITGIRGTATANANAVPVVIDSAGQLGTVSSSRRFKDEIKPMDNSSEAILGLKPVTFHYKSDTQNTPQFGLIAEEVAKVDPDLVVRDDNGEIYTVRYEAVNAMLLNEFLKEHRKNQQQEATIARLEKQIEMLAEGLQKVSAELESTKSAQQVAFNR